MKKVRDTDCRKLDHKTLTELRKRGVASVQQGESPETVARSLGINRTTIYDWLAKYRSGGWGALEARKRGGGKRKLNGRGMRWLFDTITMKNPVQLKFEFALWTCDMVRQLIARKFKVQLSRTSVNRLLTQLGLSAQRPLWRAYQQDPQKVERWLKVEYPRIKRLAAKEGADIYFGDEAGVRSDHHAGTTWSPRGVTPVVSSTGARFGFNMISAVSPRGMLRFMVVEGKVNAGVFIEFCKRLLHGATKTVFLIVDGHPSHKARKVTEWLEGLDGRLRLFLLPGYSPELNPDELVWNGLKNHALGKLPHTSKPAMRKAAESYLRSLQRCPHRIRALFNKPSTRYAAAA
jgi:transposase